LFKKVLTISRPKTPALKPAQEQSVSSKFDQNRDGSLVLIFPVKKDEYIAITTRIQDDLTNEVKGRIHFLQYKDKCKPASYFFVNTEGKLTACEFINEEWYEIHHWAHRYWTSKDLKLTFEELHINELLPQDTSSQGTPPTEVEDLLKAPEPMKQSMSSPIDNTMSLLSLEEGLEEHIASAMLAITQTVPFASSFAPTRPGTLAGPSGSGGPGRPGGPRVGGNPPAPQSVNAPQNGLRGTLPSIFEGDKKAYLTWKTELRLYHIMALRGHMHRVCTLTSSPNAWVTGFSSMISKCEWWLRRVWQYSSGQCTLHTWGVIATADEACTT
jgi:hypothetical protein